MEKVLLELLKMGNLDKVKPLHGFYNDINDENFPYTGVCMLDVAGARFAGSSFLPSFCYNTCGGVYRCLHCNFSFVINRIFYRINLFSFLKVIRPGIIFKMRYRAVILKK